MNNNYSLFSIHCSLILKIFNFKYCIMKELRQELNDEQLKEVAGGKPRKLTKSALEEAEKKRKEAEERAKQMMNSGGGFSQH